MTAPTLSSSPAVHVSIVLVPPRPGDLAAALPWGESR